MEFSDHKTFITIKSEDGTEHNHYSILCEELPEEMLQKAREQVKETEESKTEGIRKLRKYMKKEKLPDIDDEYIIAVLRCCKYDIKKSKVKLAKFIKVFEMARSNIAKFDVEDIGTLISGMAVGIFPYRDSEGRIIACAHPFLQIFSYDTELVEAGFLAAAIFVLTLPHASLLGVNLMLSCQLPEMRYFYPLMRIVMRTFPRMVHLCHRVGSVKLLNDNFICRFLYKILRPFLPDKINRRISFLSEGFGELHKDFPPGLLPQEYDGYLGPMKAELYKQKMLDRLKYELERGKCS